MIVKRTKKAPADAKGKKAADAVHYVASIDPAGGNVTGLTADRKLARDFSDDELAKFKAFYEDADEEKVGRFSVEPVVLPAADGKKAAPAG